MFLPYVSVGIGIAFFRYTGSNIDSKRSSMHFMAIKGSGVWYRHTWGVRERLE
jgi:hypothetical protein